MRHPEAYRKVQEEVDRVIGKGPIALHHIQEFKYIPAVCSTFASSGNSHSPVI